MTRRAFLAPALAFLVVTVTVAVVTVVAGCGATTARVDPLGLPLNHPVNQQQIRRLAVAGLVYPGSRVVRAIGMDERRQPGEHEPDPAFAGNVAIARVTAGALLSWYDRQLIARGYRRATYYPLADQTTGRAWTAPGAREQLQVGIYGPGSAVAATVPRGYLGYEAILVNYRVTGPPPQS